MREVMIHKTKRPFRRAEQLMKAILTALLAPHLEEIGRRVQNSPKINRLFAHRIALQIVQIRDTSRGPALANEIEVFRSNLGKFKTSANGKLWEAGVVLRTAQAFFRHGE